MPFQFALSYHHLDWFIYSGPCCLTLTLLSTPPLSSIFSQTDSSSSGLSSISLPIRTPPPRRRRKRKRRRRRRSRQLEWATAGPQQHAVELESPFTHPEPNTETSWRWSRPGSGSADLGRVCFRIICYSDLLFLHPPSSTDHLVLNRTQPLAHHIQLLPHHANTPC